MCTEVLRHSIDLSDTVEVLRTSSSISHHSVSPEPSSLYLCAMSARPGGANCDAGPEVRIEEPSRPKLPRSRYQDRWPRCTLLLPGLVDHLLCQ